MKIARLALTALLACLMSTAALAAEYSGSMNADQHLLPGDSLVSTDGKYKLVMKVDGSIARTGPTGEFWNPGKFGHELVFQFDGNLVLYDLARSRVMWSVEKGVFANNSNYKLEISNTGALAATLTAYPLVNPRTVLWELPGGPAAPTPPTGPCGAGRTYQIYPVCIPTGVGSGMNGTILACSQSEAATQASRNGWRFGSCTF